MILIVTQGNRKDGTVELTIQLLPVVAITAGANCYDGCAFPTQAQSHTSRNSPGCNRSYIVIPPPEAGLFSASVSYLLLILNDFCQTNYLNHLLDRSSPNCQASTAVDK